MRGPPESFALENAFTPSGHITRTTFLWYVLAVGIGITVLWYALFPAIITSATALLFTRYVIVYLPIIYILFNVYGKRMRNFGGRVPVTVTVFAILFLLALPLFSLAWLGFLFHGVVSVSLLLAPSHGSDIDITVRGMIHSIVSAPTVIEVTPEAGAGTYIVRVTPDTRITGVPSGEIDEDENAFSGLAEKQIVEVLGRLSSRKTLWADSINIVEQATDNANDVV